MLDAKENLEDDNGGCDITSVDKHHETFDESAILPDSENEDKVFTLFTRTAREKEEWFNHFMVAAKFMEDWEHQNPKEGLLKNYFHICTSISAAVCLNFLII